MKNEGRVVLSAEALGITMPEYAALLQVRDDIAIGAIVHDPVEDIPDFDDGDVRKGLNMVIVLNEGPCGTTACIGGWMHSYIITNTGRNPGGNNCSAFKWATTKRSKALGPLFNPLTDLDGEWYTDRNGNQIDFPYEHIDTDCALQAIDNFLGTGQPDWVGVLQVAQ